MEKPFLISSAQEANGITKAKRERKIFHLDYKGDEMEENNIV
jgi:hypothetical protein